MARRRGGGHARCLSKLTWPLPRGIQAKPAVASGGEGAEALPQPGGRALSAGRRARKRQICLFVCLWRRSLCALKSPLESKGQTSPSGEVVFVLLYKLEFSCGSHHNIWPLKMKTLPKNWATGVKTALSKSRQDGIQLQRRPQFLEGLASGEPSARGTRLFS